MRPPVVVFVLILLPSFLPSLLSAQELPDVAPRRIPVDVAERRLDGRLRRLLEAPPAPTIRPRLRGGPEASGGVHVSVQLDAAGDAGSEAGNDATIAALSAAGLSVERRSDAYRLVEGWIATSRLRALAAQPGVRSVRPIDEGVLRAGSVTSAGDDASGAARARQLSGVDGSGIVLGVISDGIDGLAASQATGDLPAVTVPPDPRCGGGSGNEGTALLEIVHDLAPGAQLLFSTGMATPLTFIQSVECLVDAGARIIVDDLGFFGEPYFQDGAGATAVRNAVAAGVTFVTSAGNGALLHYEAPFRPSPSSKYHDFRGGPVDNVDTVLVSPGGTLLCVLQWDDPMGAAADDYDLYVLDSAQNRISASENVQNGDDDPIEVVMASNPTGVAQTAGIAIARRRGAIRDLELFCVRNVTAVEHIVPQGSVIGHPAVETAITVGAVDVANPGTVEAFSAQGPSHVILPSPADRPKPDLVSFDGVLTSAPGFAPFFGTSAAAPHVAAVAALMLQKNPFRMPAEIRQALTATAVDLGAPGFDVVAGGGRMDAVAALAAIPVPECFGDPDCDDDSVCTADRCDRGVCVHAAPTCDDGDPCNGTEGCDPVTGCFAGAPLPDGAPCPDGDRCDGDETCAGAVCRPGTPLVCVDADACSTDLCAPATGCTFPPASGFDSVSCAITRGLPTCTSAAVPPQVLRRFAAAERLVDRGRTARRPPQQRRRLKRAARTLSRAMHIVARDARRGRLPATCAAQLGDARADVRDRAMLFARSLGR
jgi:subtilisin family serine protease